ncbi:unnamed protein product [marine sediment metagenome]|uniref:Uncharacterized protein n=1 Tax=marine sediment metagenome TaxID=412755 RepID=X1N2A9_9ZZZZ
MLRRPPLTLGGNPLWDSGLEMIELEARRLMNLYPLGSKAVIKRTSDKGWHLRFPDSRLTWPEMEAILATIPIEHFGHRFFSMVTKDDTLRVGPKPDGTHEPYTVKVIRKRGE